MVSEQDDTEPMNVNLPSSSFSGGRNLSDNTIKWQESAGDVLSELEHDMKGEELNIETGKYVRRYESLMNNSGINCIKSIIRTRANKIVFLSKLSEKNVIDMCRDINMDLVDQIALKHQQWQLKKENCTMIVLKVVQLTFCALMKAEGGEERESLGKTWGVHEIIRGGSSGGGQPEMQPQRKRFLFW